MQTNQGEAATFISFPLLVLTCLQTSSSIIVSEEHGDMFFTTLNIHNAESALWMICRPDMLNVQTTNMTVLWICEWNFSEWNIAKYYTLVFI